jgi:hypothetical protein
MYAMGVVEILAGRGALTLDRLAVHFGATTVARDARTLRPAA